MGIYFLLLVVGACWGQYNPNTLSKRTSIVHLFEWRWVDIAVECERYLAPNGFGGVQWITYCDIISGQKKGDYCTAVEVHVAADGMANFLIGNEDKDPFIVIHIDAKL